MMNKLINANDALKTKKVFEECRLEVISFDCKDVITASPEKDDFVGIPGTWVGVYRQQ